jgi:hypothetical protein
MSELKIFQESRIRAAWNKEEEQWYFSVVDVVGVLTDSVNPTDYLKKIRKRDPELASFLGTNCPHVAMRAESGKYRKVLSANIKSILRIIQSIPSPKAEPFKQWLAQVGYDRVLEIENPELAQERMKFLYEQKGYSKDWIDKRLRGIAIRQNLTDEWKRVGITKEREYAILTAEISKATFGVTPSEYKTIKGLENTRENLRDHMDDLELIFTMLGERVTTELSQKEDPKSFKQSKNVARRGGNVAGIARKQTEKELGRCIVSSDNFLDKSIENNEPDLFIE